MKLTVSYSTIFGAKHDIVAIIKEIRKLLPQDNQQDVEDLFGSVDEVDNKVFKLKKGITGVEISLEDEFIIDIISEYGTLVLQALPHIISLIKLLDHSATTTIPELWQKWFSDDTKSEVACAEDTFVGTDGREYSKPF